MKVYLDAVSYFNNIRLFQQYLLSYTNFSVSIPLVASANVKMTDICN